MDFEYSYILSLLIVFVFTFILKLAKTNHRNKNLPPGPWKFPFIGNLHLLSIPTFPPHHILRNLATKYGPLMHLQLGEIGVVVVSSPEIAKQFLITNDLVFASRPSLLATEINCFGNTDIAFAPYGDYWRQLRKICSLHLFTATRVQSFRRIREEEVSSLCKTLAINSNSTINLTENLTMTNLNIMVRAAFGKKSGDGVVDELKSIIREAQGFFTVFNVVDVYPSLRFLMVFSWMKKKIEDHHRRLDRITESIIEERRREIAEDDGRVKDGDFLDVLLRLQADGSLQVPLTTNNIKSVLLDGAGVDSSTTTTYWAMAEMLNNPNILKKGQDEVRTLFDAKKHVNEGSLHELHYLKLVIKETLRLHPPGPLLLPRQSQEPCEINGYEIPAKTWVLVNAWAIGRDPKYWEDAERFKPERFLEKAVDFKATAMEFIPFGAGRRICPGVAFAIANIEIVLAMLLYHFDWILPCGMKEGELDMEEGSGLYGKRKRDLSLIPVVMRPLM